MIRALNWYKTIKKYYDLGKYTLDQMRVFVEVGKITEEEFEEITGIPYED